MLGEDNRRLQDSNYTVLRYFHRKKMTIGLFLLAGIFLFLMIRLAYFMVFRAEYFAEKAQELH